jgi:hypothetical protein
VCVRLVASVFIIAKFGVETLLWVLVCNAYPTDDEHAVALAHAAVVLSPTLMPLLKPLGTWVLEISVRFHVTSTCTLWAIAFHSANE